MTRRIRILGPMYLQSVTARTSWLTSYIYCAGGFFGRILLVCRKCPNSVYNFVGRRETHPQTIKAFEKSFGPFPGRGANRHTVTVLFFARHYRFLVPCGHPNQKIYNRVKKLRGGFGARSAWSHHVTKKTKNDVS